MIYVYTFVYPERQTLLRYDDYQQPIQPPEFDPAAVMYVAVFALAMWTQTTTYEDGSFDVLGRYGSWNRSFDDNDGGTMPIRMQRDHWGL